MAIEKQTYHEGPFQEFLAAGVRVGDAVYLSGQVGVDANGKAGDTLTKQIEIAYANIQRVVGELGATMDDIVDETMFVTSIDEFNAEVAELVPVRAAAYGGKPNVSQTLIEISRLFQPELKVEIKVIAHVRG